MHLLCCSSAPLLRLRSRRHNGRVCLINPLIDWMIDSNMRQKRAPPRITTSSGIHGFGEPRGPRATPLSFLLPSVLPSFLYNYLILGFLHGPSQSSVLRLSIFNSPWFCTVTTIATFKYIITILCNIVLLLYI